MDIGSSDNMRPKLKVDKAKVRQAEKLDGWILSDMANAILTMPIRSRKIPMHWFMQKSVWKRKRGISIFGEKTCWTGTTSFMKIPTRGLPKMESPWSWVLNTCSQSTFRHLIKRKSLHPFFPVPEGVCRILLRQLTPGWDRCSQRAVLSDQSILSH